jgi:hypothetical protein
MKKYSIPKVKEIRKRKINIKHQPKIQFSHLTPHIFAIKNLDFKLIETH